MSSSHLVLFAASIATLAIPMTHAGAATFSGYIDCANALRAAQGEPSQNFLLVPSATPDKRRVIYVFAPQGAYYVPIGEDSACGRVYISAENSPTHQDKVQVTCKEHVVLESSDYKKQDIYFTNQVQGNVAGLYAGPHTDQTWIDTAPGAVDRAAAGAPAPVVLSETPIDGMSLRKFDKLDRSAYSTQPANDQTTATTQAVLENRLVELMSGLTQKLKTDVSQNKLTTWALHFELEKFKEAFEACKKSTGPQAETFLPKYREAYEALVNVPTPPTVGAPSEADEAVKGAGRAASPH